MAKWAEEQKAKALAIAEASTCREASEQTGIPEGSIKRWRKEIRTAEPNRTGRTEPSKKVQKIAEEAVEQAKVAVKDYVEERTREYADQLLNTAMIAQKELVSVIENAPKDEANLAEWSQWTKALVGAIDYMIKNNLLLTGQPTSRQAVEGEVKQINEQRHHIIQEIINTPGIADQIRNNFRRRIGEGISQD